MSQMHKYVPKIVHGNKIAEKYRINEEIEGIWNSLHQNHIYGIELYTMIARILNFCIWNKLPNILWVHIRNMLHRH